MYELKMFMNWEQIRNLIYLNSFKHLIIIYLFNLYYEFLLFYFILSLLYIDYLVKNTHFIPVSEALIISFILIIQN